MGNCLSPHSSHLTETPGEKDLPFLHLALNMLDNPETQVEITKPHLSMREVRCSHLSLLTSGGFVLCYMEDVNKFPLFLFRTALSISCTPQNALIRVREEEPCSEFKPLASFCFVSHLFCARRKKNVLPEGEFFV